MPGDRGVDVVGDDEVDRDRHVGLAGVGHGAMPDSWLPAEHEAGARHGVAEQRCIGEPLGVEDQIGVGGERLIAGDAVDGAEVDGLCADEYERVEVACSPVSASRSTRRASTYSCRLSFMACRPLS